MFIARFALREVKHIPIKYDKTAMQLYQLEQEYQKRIQTEKLRLEAILKNVNQVAFKNI